MIFRITNHSGFAAPADALDFDAVTATHVTGFLDHLEQERGNSTRTRNARLTAIRAVLSAHLTAANLKAEADYFARKESR